MMKSISSIVTILLGLLLFACSNAKHAVKAGNHNYDWKKFVMGADLSYVNQLEDHGVMYYEEGKQKDPFRIFKDHGCNTVRVRLWHYPKWTKETSQKQLYSDLADVEKTIRRAKQLGMAVNLDLHYSDEWADPGRQTTPKAWENIGFDTLKDSVYAYTLAVLNYLAEKNLVPEMIQVGNETNAGMLWPQGKVDWQDEESWRCYGILVNSGIKAVRDFSQHSEIKPQVIIHVSQLQHAEAWVKNMVQIGGVTDFDILGISHYYKWSEVNDLQQVEQYTRRLVNNYHKKVMIVEVAFPWTNENADNYNNILDDPKKLTSLEAGKNEQLEYLTALAQYVINGGGSGIIYWEPAWVSSNMKDRWGQGSCWENATFFDFNNQLLPGIDYMRHPYQF